MRNWRLSTFAPEILEQIVSFDEGMQRELASASLRQRSLRCLWTTQEWTVLSTCSVRARSTTAFRGELQALVDALDQQQWDYEARIDAGATDLADPRGFARASGGRSRLRAPPGCLHRGDRERVRSRRGVPGPTQDGVRRSRMSSSGERRLRLERHVTVARARA
jgi:hypothetical protein